MVICRLKSRIVDIVGCARNHMTREFSGGFPLEVALATIDGDQEKTWGGALR
jgi:hypothetical protein